MTDITQIRQRYDQLRTREQELIAEGAELSQTMVAMDRQMEEYLTLKVDERSVELANLLSQAIQDYTHQLRTNLQELAEVHTQRRQLYRTYLQFLDTLRKQDDV